MKRIVLVVVVAAAAVTAQEFRWAWKDTVGKYVEWQGDQGGGNTVLMGPTATIERCQVVGLSSGGSPAWTALVDTITPEVGCIGAGGNIYLAGARRFPGYQAQLVALTSGGQERWRWLINSPYPHDDHLTCVADNNQGLVFAGGEMEAGYRMFSLDAATGALVDSMYFWQQTCNGLFKLARAGGAIYGVGSAWSGTDEDWLIFKWDGHGTLPTWANRLHGSTGLDDVAHGLAVSGDGAYVIGQVQYTNDHDQFAVCQLSLSSGGQQWGYVIQDSVRTSVGIDVAVGDDGNVYALGQAANASSGQDLVVVALTSGGRERWTYRFQPGGNRWAWAKAIKLGSDNSVYVFGDCTNGSYNSDMLMVCLTTDGRLRWSYQYDGGSDDYTHPDCGFYSSDGKLYAAGTTREGSTTKSVAISVASVIGIEEALAGTAPAVTLTTHARGALRSDAGGTLFDSRGRKVADLSAGTNDVSRLAPGVYVLRTRARGAGGSRVLLVK